MAKNKELRDKIFGYVKPLIPTEIVMTPIAYRDPLKQQRTIENVRDRVKKEFVEKYPSYASDWDLINDTVEMRILCRIVVGNSNPEA
jgi:hypothetical protein